MDGPIRLDCSDKALPVLKPSSPDDHLPRSMNDLLNYMDGMTYQIECAYSQKRT